MDVGITTAWMQDVLKLLQQKFSHASYDVGWLLVNGLNKW